MLCYNLCHHAPANKIPVLVLFVILSNQKTKKTSVNGFFSEIVKKQENKTFQESFILQINKTHFAFINIFASVLRLFFTN